jgi:hypothetical protein
MPAYTKTGKHTYCYKCQCGKDMTLITNETPGRLVKCFECIKEEEKKYEHIQKAK